jgi:ribonuclease HI
MNFLWTDGSSDRQGFGGWAFCITDSEADSARIIAEENQPRKDTTNNRMELEAVIKGLRMCNSILYPVEITVRSDSAYVVNCFLQRWYVKWLNNNWVGSAGPVLNKDLWTELLILVNKMVERGFVITWTHVKGHRDSYWNNRVDQFAGAARRRSLSS